MWSQNNGCGCLWIILLIILLLCCCGSSDSNGCSHPCPHHHCGHEPRCDFDCE